MFLRHHVCRSAHACTVSSSSSPTPAVGRRCLSSSALAGLKQPVQSYVSTSHDPFLNLSIEHHLLQTSAPHSAVLFLYINRPSIIIGRNQNPWLEVNLARLRPWQKRPDSKSSGLGAVDLVRRRSGGGTVFHDEGNVNWSVICPAANFTRDKHAEMVVRALRNCNVDRARVNARHDIVLDQGQRGHPTDPDDTHSTPYEAVDFDTPKPLKVSGSAYKLTRLRALHHGTCLLSSPNLKAIPDYLHSPAKPFITARGVESVSSPVGNISIRNSDFIRSVQEQFAKEYSEATMLDPTELGDEWLEDENILRGYDELKSLEWTYLQTPQFTVSTKSQAALDTDVEFVVRHGAISNGKVIISAEGGAADTTVNFSNAAIGQKLHQVVSWEDFLRMELDQVDPWQKARVTQWLERMLPTAQ